MAVYHNWSTSSEPEHLGKGRSHVRNVKMFSGLFFLLKHIYLIILKPRRQIKLPYKNRPAVFLRTR